MINMGFISGLCVGTIELASAITKPLPNPPDYWRTWYISSPIRWALAGLVTQIGIETLFDLSNDRSLIGSLSLAFTIGELVYAVETNPNINLRINSIVNQCILKWKYYFSKSETESDDSYIKRIESVMQQDWENAMRGQYTDISIRVGNQTFTAHKLILCNRSEYFAALFRSQLREAKSGEIRIEDQQPHVVELALKYLYCQTLKNEKITNYELVELSNLADVWILPQLKNFCMMLTQQRVRNLMRLNGLPDNIEVAE